VLAGDPDAIAAAAHDLESPDRPTRIVAMLDLALAGSTVRELVPALIAAADKDDEGDVRDVVLPHVLGAIGGERAVQRLASDALSPHIDIRRLIKSLAAQGHDAAQAAPALRTLATSHYLGDVRAQAAGAYEKVSGEHIEPALVPCPKLVRESAAGWTAVLSSRTMSFARIEWPDGEAGERARELAAGTCLPVMKEHRAYVGLRVGDSCLVGRNRGEWGGGVLAIDRAGKIQRIVHSYQGSELFVDEGPQGVLLFEGIGHLRLDRGRVKRLVLRPDGTWHSDTIADLEINPVGFVRDADRRLVLLARNSEELADRTAPLACRTYPSYVVVRIDDEGHVETLE
jgi:hypothetical protein